MADIQILHQEVTLLKLRIASLESQRKNLESDLSVAIVERDQADETNKTLSDRLRNSEKICSGLELDILRERQKSNAAMSKIIQLENQLSDLLSTDESD